MLLASFPVSVRANGYNETWVDDDWDDPNENTDPDPYFNSIQSALDNTYSYGVVHVAPGTYDSVEIDDPVTLLGSGWDTEIAHDNVLIDIYCSDVYVSGFCLHHCDVGVYAESDSPDLYNITIANCYIYAADYACVWFVDCQNSTVINCELSSDEEEAAAVAFESCVNCAVEDCVIYRNGVGVFIDESVGCRVSGCWIVENMVGVWLGEEPFSVYGCIVSGCVIEENGEGVILGPNSADCQIIGNTIRNNEALFSGIHALVDADINQALLNNINGNIYGAYLEEDGEYPLLVGMLNWWGHASGPYHEYYNPLGEGDEITNKVYFEPWLSVMITNGTTEWVEGDGVLNGLNETDAAVDYYNAEGWESPACLSVVGYADNPGDPFVGDIGKYIDVIHSMGDFDELLILLFYTDADIEGFDEESLQMYYMSYMEEDGWQPCSYTGVDTNPYGFDDGEVDLDLVERWLIPPIVEDPLNDAEYAMDDIVRGYCVDDGEGFIFMMEMLTGPIDYGEYYIVIDSDQNPDTGLDDSLTGIDYIIVLGDPPVLLEWNEGAGDFDYVKEIDGFVYPPEHLLFAYLPFDDIDVTLGNPIDIAFVTGEEIYDIAPDEGLLTYTGPPYSGYIWAIINEETTPSTYDLTWMEGPFGARGDQKPIGPAEPVGGDIFTIDKLAVLTPYLLVALAIATATSILIKKRKH